MLVQYELLNEYLKTWKNSKEIHGILISGPVGMSKTYSVEEVLKDVEYDLINTHTTPLKLYIELYNSRNNYLVIDDVLELFKNKDTSGLLIAALHSSSKPRRITWQTTSEKLGDVPYFFNYKGKIAIICNKLPIHLEHLKSRCFYYELMLNYDEIIEKLEEVSKSMNLPDVIMKFVKENTDESTLEEVLNIRLLIKLNSIYQEFPEKWKEIGLYLIKQDKKLYILKKILEKYENLEDQVEMYKKISGRKRTSFYEDRKKLL